MPIRTLIDTLRAEPNESEWLEFKHNNDQPQLIGEYLSALSNSACLCGKAHGYLVFGIDDKTHDIVGTLLQPHRAKGKGNEGLEPWLARLLAPQVDFTIIEYIYDDKRVVLFRVDATLNTPVKFSGQAYIRIGEHKYNLKDYPEKERKLWMHTPATTFENGAALKNQSSDDVLNKIAYPEFCDLLQMPLPDNRTGVLNKLEEEKVIAGYEDKYSITNQGAILFAKDLNQFPSLKRKALRVIVYKDDSRLNAEREQISSKGYALGFEDLVNSIYEKTPANELIEGAMRVVQKMYPIVAIREFAANALIHQDFSIGGAGPMVEIFPSRIEITNPGASLVSVDRFIDHAPRSRNESLASLMRRMNICEERGSGVDRALNVIELAQLPAPEFQGEPEYTRVTLFSHREFRDMTRSDRVRACYQHCCLRWVLKDYMSNASLRLRLGVKESNYSMVSRIIKQTIDAGFIKPSEPDIFSNRNRKYIPNWG